MYCNAKNSLYGILILLLFAGVAACSNNDTTPPGGDPDQALDGDVDGDADGDVEESPDGDMDDEPLTDGDDDLDVEPEAEPEADEELLPVSILDTTKVLDARALEQLESYNPDSGEMIFAAGGALPEIAVDDVVNGGIAENCPFGFLRKVTGIQEEDSRLILETRQATLQEAIETASVRVTTELSADQVISGVPALRGVEWQRNPTGKASMDFQFYVGLNNVLLYDADGDSKTTHDQLRATGGVGITPALTFNVDVEYCVPVGIYFGSSLEVTGGLTVQGSGDVDFDKEVTLYTWEFAPISVPIGPVVLVFVPELSFFLRADGSVQASMVFGAVGTSELEAGMSMAFGDWGPSVDFSKHFNFPEPMISASGTAKASTGADLGLYLYGFVGGSGRIGMYLKADADVNADPWWELGAGLEAKAHFTALGYDKDMDLLNEYWPMKTAEGPYTEEPTGKPGHLHAYHHEEIVRGDDLQTMVSMSDGGFVAFGTGDTLVHAMRMDANGQIMWQKDLAFDGLPEVYDALVTADGGILAVGENMDQGLICKLDGGGNLLWARQVAALGSDNSSVLKSVAALPAGGYVAVGEGGFNDTVLETVGWMAFFNGDGTVSDARSFEDSEGDWWTLSEVVPADDGTLFAAGQVGYFSELWVAKLSREGVPLWHKTYKADDSGDTRYLSLSAAASDGHDGMWITGTSVRRANPFTYVMHIASDGSGDSLRIMNRDTTGSPLMRFDGLDYCGGTLVGAGRMEIIDEDTGMTDYHAIMAAISETGLLTFALEISGDANHDFFGDAACRMDGKGYWAVGQSRTAADAKSDGMALFTPVSGLLYLPEASGLATNYLGDQVDMSMDIVSESAELQSHDLQLEVTTLNPEVSDYGAVEETLSSDDAS